jgi:oxygen-dependent protoporphyrinogen oxidase
MTGSMDGTLDVAIVGGGIAGLSAAYELQRRGCSVRVLEAGERPGGVIRTERFDGWVVDCGPDALLAQKPGGVGLCRELGIADRLITTRLPRTAYVLRDDRLHPLAEGSFLGFPLSFRALATSSLFTAAGKVRMAAEVGMPRRTWHEDDDESIGAFVRRRFGHEAAEYLADPLLAGIHAGDADELSVRTLFPRLVDAERQSGSVLRALRAMKMTRSAQGAFVSLPGGTGELVDALAAARWNGPGARCAAARSCSACRPIPPRGSCARSTPAWPAPATASRTRRRRRWPSAIAPTRCVTRCRAPGSSCPGPNGGRSWRLRG